MSCSYIDWIYEFAFHRAPKSNTSPPFMRTTNVSICSFAKSMGNMPSANQNRMKCNLKNLLTSSITSVWINCCARTSKLVLKCFWCRLPDWPAKCRSNYAVIIRATRNWEQNPFRLLCAIITVTIIIIICNYHELWRYIYSYVLYLSWVNLKM